MPFDVEKFIEDRDQSFLQEFGWPEIDDEGYSGEEGEGD
jgi:hypothetical protein